MDLSSLLLAPGPSGPGGDLGPGPLAAGHFNGLAPSSTPNIVDPLTDSSRLFRPNAAFLPSHTPLSLNINLSTPLGVGAPSYLSSAGPPAIPKFPIAGGPLALPKVPLAPYTGPPAIPKVPLSSRPPLAGPKHPPTSPGVTQVSPSLATASLSDSWNDTFGGASPLTPGVGSTDSVEPSTPTSAGSAATTKGYKNKKVKPANRDNISQEWTLRDKALFRRALVRYGASFTEIAQAIGTKTYTTVKDYYKTLGGGKTPWIKPLLAAHTRMKKQNKLEEWSIVLTEEEEEAVTQGRLRKLVEEEEVLVVKEPEASKKFGQKLRTEDPTQGLTGPQLKEFTKYKVDLILKANSSNIYMGDNFASFETAVHKKHPLLRKPTFARSLTAAVAAGGQALSTKAPGQAVSPQCLIPATSNSPITVPGLGTIGNLSYMVAPAHNVTTALSTHTLFSSIEKESEVRVCQPSKSLPNVETLSPAVLPLRMPLTPSPATLKPVPATLPPKVKAQMTPNVSLERVLASRLSVLDHTQFICENELALGRLHARLALDAMLRQKKLHKSAAATHYEQTPDLRWFTDQSFSPIHQTLASPVVVDTEGVVTYLTTEIRTKSRPDEQQLHLCKVFFDGHTVASDAAASTTVREAMPGGYEEDILFDATASCRELTRDGSLLVISNGKHIYLVDAINTSKTFGQSLLRLDGHSTTVCAIGLSPAGFLASGDKTGLVRIWNLRNITHRPPGGSQFKFTHTFKDSVSIAKISFVPGRSDAVITASAERNARIWDLAANSNQPMVALRFGEVSTGAKPPQSAAATDGPPIVTLGPAKVSAPPPSPTKPGATPHTVTSNVGVGMQKWFIAAQGRSLYIFDLHAGKLPAPPSTLAPVACAPLPPEIKSCSVVESHPAIPNLLFVVDISTNAEPNGKVLPPALHLVYLTVKTKETQAPASGVPRPASTPAPVGRGTPHTAAKMAAAQPRPSITPNSTAKATQTVQAKVRVLESLRYHPSRRSFLAAAEYDHLAEHFMEDDPLLFKSARLAIAHGAAALVVSLEVDLAKSPGHANALHDAHALLVDLSARHIQ